uniref:Uncharacterized protein n=1 Tax=Meloidogyne enterolobii TaxID=390850 RepID=A0A6V7WZ67_MELEN|nr:unnamed protein product [Meloidogyne enterolobii]
MNFCKSNIVILPQTFPTSNNFKYRHFLKSILCIFWVAIFDFIHLFLHFSINFLFSFSIDWKLFKRYFTDLDRKNADFRLCDPQISKIFGYLLVGNTRRVIPKSFKFDDPRLSRASTSRQFQIFHSVESWDN